jgi:hypothetical protein
VKARLGNLARTLLACAIALAGSVAAADEPSLPRLEDTPPRASAGPAAEGARALPETETVCRDSEAGRCFVRPGESDCGPGPARPYRTVIAVPGRGDGAAALAQCERELREDRDADGR